MLGMDISNKIKHLSKVLFFSNLTNDQLGELAKEFEWQEYTQGSEIIKQGQKIEFFYVITGGRVESLVKKDSHDILQINTFGPGNAFGEISLLTGNPAASTIRCLDDCRILALDATQFALMLVRWPNLNQKIIEKLSERLSTVNDYLWQAKYKEFLRSAMQLSQYKEKFYGIWGGKGTTERINAKIQELSVNPENLLITGESGTGRQMMAWYIHKSLFGETAPFIVINGRHFDEQWGESFNSLFNLIEDGTLLIKGLDSLSTKAQFNLAQALHTEEIKCFVVGTTIIEESQLIPELHKCFKQTFRIKPLRDRKRDIPVIAQGVLEELARKNNREVPVLDHESTTLLLSHNYRQSNTTELIQVIERAFSLAKNNTISIEHIFFGPTAHRAGKSINLLSWQPLKEVIRKGKVIFALRGLTSIIFILIIVHLLFRPHIPLAVDIFTIVWGLWWPALVIFSPFIGRIWCTVCPFSTIMEFVQKYIHWNRPVPDILKKYDYLFITFLFLLVFWVEVVTGMRANPMTTGILLLIILILAILVGIIYTRHAWCKNLCPLGGLVGTASIGSMLEVRADPNICLNKCTTLDCYVGNDKAPGCPMSQHLPYLDNNLDCKLCFNCVKNCPNDSVQLNIRIPAQEVWHLVRVNQGFSLFIGVTLAILIPINYFETVQSVWPEGLWQLWFSVAYWATALIAGILTWLVVRPYKTKAASKRVKLIFAFIPLLLAGHIMYQLHFVPGFDTLFLGLGTQSDTGQIDGFYTPLYIVGQVLAGVIGIMLTSFSVIMVLWHSKQKRTAKSNQ